MRCPKTEPQMMTKLKGQLDEEKILSMAKDLDILYPMQLFAQAAIRYLRVSPEISAASRCTDGSQRPSEANGRRDG